MPPGLSSAVNAMHHLEIDRVLNITYSAQMTMKRIQRELADLKKEDLGDMTLQPNESNLHIWSGRIPGPQGSLYEGGIFELEMLLPADYPFSAPKVMFKTRIYHMNISDHGAICIDILKGQWSPALSLFKVMLSLSSLLTDPNPKDPLVPSIATQYLRNRKQHDETARQWVKMFATPKPPAESAKGKARAAEGSSSSAAAPTTRRSTRSTAALAEEVIVLSDSEAEGDADHASKRQPKKRKRGSDVPPVPEGEVLELDDSEDEQDAPKRTKARVNRTAGSAAGGTSSATSPSADEVIVLD